MTATYDVSPLAGWQPRFDAVADPSLKLQLRELPFLTQVLLRVDLQRPVAGAIQSALGLTLPPHFGQYTRSNELDACWLGPDEWLLTSSQGAAPSLIQTITHAAQGSHHMSVDVSANRTCIEMRGADARYVLAKGCHEDTSAEAFRGTRVVQTVLAKVPVILQLHSDAPAFRVWVRNSFATYIAQWLTDAGMEIVHARRHGFDSLQSRFAGSPK